MTPTCSTMPKKSIDDITEVRLSAGGNPEGRLAYDIISNSCLVKKYWFNRASDTSVPELKIDNKVYEGIDEIRKAVEEYC